MSTDTENLKLIEDVNTYTGGLLNLGEKINGCVITKKLNTDSGEAELYLCEKSNKLYILKYYYKKNIFNDLAEKLTSLNHKNVMKILDVGEYKKHSYEIDEYYEGGTLEQELPLPENIAFSIFEQINEGLKAIHSNGIIHRDIKAENIYFKDVDHKEIVIGDFGIATLYDQQDDVNEHLTKIDSGTDGYKAPESFNGVISPAIDYYSFGILTWNILTGKTPFVEESGEPFSTGRIRYETINDTVTDYLLSTASTLSEKSKKLISGLLVYRHDQRWRYEEVKSYLSGADVKIFTERRELPAFEFAGKELFTLKSIAEELISNKEAGIELIKGSSLTRYLDKNDLGNISAQIEKIQEKILSKSLSCEEFETILGGINTEAEKEKFALIKIAFALCSNITFHLTCDNKCYNIDTIADFIDLLLYHPMAIRPYLLTESSGLYEKLETFSINIDEESLASWVKRYSKSSTNERILPISLYLELNGNKISPFKDKINADIVLESKADIEQLDSNLKDRLMYLIDAKDKMLIAWFENIYNINMNNWYGELEGGPNHDEDIAQLRRNKLLAFGKWKYFELFLQGRDVIYRNYFVNNGKYGLLNLDGTVLWDAQFDDVHCEFIRNRYILKQGNKWFVYNYNGGSDEGIVILKDQNELSVFDENINIYKASTYDNKDFLIESSENDFLYLEKNEYLNNHSLCEFTGYSELEKHNICFSNYVNQHYELLNSLYKVVGTFDQLQVITSEGSVPTELKFWVTKNDRVSIITKDCNVLKELPYTSFAYTNNGYFIVTDIEGKHKVVDSDATIIQENVKDYRSSGIIATVKRSTKSKWELQNLSDKTWKLNGKKFKYVGYLGPSIFVLNSPKKIELFTENKDQIVCINIKQSGKHSVVSNSNGDSKSFIAINSNTIKEAYIPSETSKKHYDILGFDGKAFYKYNFYSNSFILLKSKEFVFPNEFTSLMDNIESKNIIDLVRTHIKNKDYKNANIIINFTWEYYYEKKDFETVRFLLSSIRMDQMQGLDMYYLYYKNRLGYTYMTENEQLKDFCTEKDLFKKNQNYIHALHYLLSAAGKEVSENGEIITAPYASKLKLTPQMLMDCAMDCAEVCINISNVKQTLHLDYGWTKEYIRSVASKILQNLFDYFTDDTYTTSETYLYTHRLGSLMFSIGDIDNALLVFQSGKKCEPEFQPINEIKLFDVFCFKNKQKEALGIYEHLEKIFPDIRKDQTRTAEYNSIRKSLGI